MATGEPGCVLGLECIRHVVTFQRLLRVVEQGADIGAAGEISEPQGEAAAHDARPMCAAVQAFFALLAEVEDTNLVFRGGPGALRFARGAARRFLSQGGVHGAHAQARALEAHRAFVARHLSPGGCADLLAACLFIVAIEG